MAVAAFFDVDGTVTRTTVLDPLVWYQRARLPRLRFALWSAGLLARVPLYVWIDRRDRARFNRLFFRRYKGLPADALRAWHRDTFADNLRRRVFPAALGRLRDHRERGHRTVLLTGGLDFVMRPLADYLGADDLIATRLEEEGGAFTGELLHPPITGEEKAVLVRGYADRNGIDLGQSFAYADGWTDVAALECVGRPSAVNPEGRLRAHAAARDWPVVTWGGSLLDGRRGVGDDSTRLPGRPSHE